MKPAKPEPPTEMSSAIPAVDPDGNRDAIAAETIASLCKAGADPLRMVVLRLLARDSFGVLELAQIVDCTQSGMSHHLKVLAGAGLVAKRREGNSIFYRRADRALVPALAPLQDSLLASADQLALDAPVLDRLETVQAERAERSRLFFDEHAAAFRQQQELIAEYALYGAQTAQQIAAAFPRRGGLALEIGPGEGAFLGELSNRFAHVVAVDSSPLMLAQARQRIAADGLANIELIEGDTRHPRLQGLNADCAVLNMVLHHVASPAALFRDLAASLAPGGQLFVTDLCYHGQGWVQLACGDLWLGFEPEELGQWATAAGLVERGSGIYLAQRNGFRVQIRQFELPTEFIQQLDAGRLTS